METHPTLPAGSDSGQITNSSEAAIKLRYFRVYVLIHVAAATGLRLQYGVANDYLPPVLTVPITLIGTSLIAAALVSLLPKYRDIGLPLATLLAGTLVVLRLPATANHEVLEFLCLLFLCLASGSEDHCEAVLNALCYTFAIILFYTGVQKLVYGRYFDGQFLAYMINKEDRFAFMFQYAMSSDEFQMVRSINLRTPGDGPFQFESLFLKICSNLVYVLEMLIPVAMLYRRTRVIATVAAMALIAAIELPAREVIFGVLFINIALLFLGSNWIKRLLPVSLAFHAYVVLISLGLLPHMGLLT